MNPRSVSIRKVGLAVFLIATALGLFFTLQIHYAASAAGHQVSWGQSLYWAFGDWYEWALLSPALLWLSQRFLFTSKTWVKSAAVHLVAGALISILHAAMCAGAAILQAHVTGPPTTFVEAFRQLVTHRFHFNFAAYGLIVCAWHAWIFQRQSQERARESQDLARRLAETRLEMLRAQLNPHFLFNTLNTISSLMLTDPDAANQMMARLGDLLRVALEHRDGKVSLKKELALLRQYLDIEQVRFGDRLSLRLEVAPETLEAAVPSMILQPIVENAIRHGLEDADDATITLRARGVNGSLHLEVEDNGKPSVEKKSAHAGHGIGLANTRSRLRLLYGDDHKFELIQRADGVSANITIPLHLVTA